MGHHQWSADGPIDLSTTRPARPLSLTNKVFKLADYHQSSYQPVAALPSSNARDESGVNIQTYHRPSCDSLSVQTSQLPSGPDPRKTRPSPYTLLTPPYAAADAAVNDQNSMTRDTSTKSTPTSQTLQNSPFSMTEPEASHQLKSDKTQTAKPKRVRTGCLTCRERHLKCDEGLPHCQNCKKSNRKCKRGIRLNFIDILNEPVPYFIPRTHDWNVNFQDDSRDIASEYQGGLEKYHPLEPERKRQRLESSNMSYDYGHIAAPLLAHQELPAQQYSNTYAEPAHTIDSNSTNQPYREATTTMASYADPNQGTRHPYQQTMSIPTGSAPGPYLLVDPYELLYLQVFVEEVGVWMDSMDPEKHFSRIVPFQAMKEPMLRYALLACGIRHLNLLNKTYPEEHALEYYNNTTQLLLKSLQNPDRDSILCATAATILNVYEIMSETALQRMNHIAGARALIKECQWDANSTGIGAACFWLNVGLELFSCMHFNWSVAWDPDTWGINIHMDPQHVGGQEEEWTHKMLWILSKITNFRAESQRRYHHGSAHAEQVRLRRRQSEWTFLKQFCDRWHKCVPPTMHAIGRVPAHMTRLRSAFPESWFIKRTTIIARLFYHTGMALLGSVHPLADIQPEIGAEMHEMKLHHSKQVCSIVAHVKDRGVASASIRCLAVAGENLIDRREQEEVLQIYDRIKLETGWRVDVIHDDLREKWGWTSNAGDYDNISSASAYYAPSASSAQGAPTPTRLKYPSGIVNPLYKDADFSAQNPPYQGNYVPPTHANVMHHNSTQMFGFSGIAAL